MLKIKHLFILSILSILIFINPAFGETIYVPGDYTTIQEGIDAATAGDTVLVADGIYYGSSNKNLTFHTSGITVQSENGPDNCIIHCEGDGRGFFVRDKNGTVISGFTITGGNAPLLTGYGYRGGAIYCHGSTVTINNCIITGNKANNRGGGINFYFSSGIISNCTIENNKTTASLAGGQNDHGGGIYCNYSSPSIENCYIKNNLANNNGGGIYLKYSSPNITNCCITENQAGRVNSVGIEGGGVYSLDSSPNIINCTISNNSFRFYEVGSVTDKCGGIYCDNWNTQSGNMPNITNCILWGNNGSQIARYYCTPNVRYSDIQGGYTGIENIDADPLFIGDGNYHFGVGSSCIDTGTSTDAPNTDIVGTSRPQGNGYDMGAYEGPDLSPPTADAGPYQTVNEGETVTLNGSGSSDPNDGIASYLWEQTEGTSVTLSDPNAVQPTFTAPNIGVNGETLSFRLTVTDSGGLQDTDTCTVSCANVTYKIIACTGSGGSISPSGVKIVEYESDQTFVITPNDGNHIVDVLVDGSSVGAVAIYTFADINADHTIMAIFDVEYEKLNNEFQTNTYTDDWQTSPSVAGLSDGGFVVVWQSFGQDDDGSGGIYGQLFNAAGEKNGEEFQVNTYIADEQSSISVVGLSDAGFVVVWQSPGQDNDGSTGIYGQLFNAAGEKNGEEFQVNTYTLNHQYQPAVAALCCGNFVVTWTSYGQGSDGYDIYGQMFDSSGNRVDGEFRVSSNIDDWEQRSSLSGLSNGGFVVTWHSYYDQDGDGYGIFGQIFDSSGSKVGDEFQVNTYGINHQRSPAVSGLASGFVVTWQSNYQEDGWSEGIYGQIFDNLGNKIGSELHINTFTTGAQGDPSVTALSGDCFVVAWMSYGGETGIYGQVFCGGTGNKIGEEFLIKASTQNNIPSLSRLLENGFVCAWSYQEVYGQLWTETYTLTATAGNHGSISPLGTVKAPRGSEQTFIITPDSGYHIFSTVIDGLSIGATTNYTFTNISSGHTISADFVNSVPIADAGTDQTVDEGVTVILNGSGSSDPDGGITSYLWTQTEGTSVTLSDPNAVQPTFTAPNVTLAGDILTFQLTVTDAGGLTDTDTVSITIGGDNDPPVADVGAGQSVNEGTTVTLDGSNSSDPDDGIATYLWEQTAGTAVTLSDASAPQPTFTAPDVGIDGDSLTFELIVTDNGGLQHTDTCTVIIAWVNVSPVADAGAGQSVNEGATVTLDGSGSTDIDDGIATYLWTQTDGKQAALSDPNAQKPTFTAPNVTPAGDILTFQLTVTDAGDLTDTDTVSITVGGDNDPPVADAGADQTVDEGTTVTLDGSGSTDPDDGIASYVWAQTGGTEVTLSNASTTQPTFVAPDVGTEGGIVSFQLTVTDNGGLEHTDTCTVTVSWVNVPPVADAGADQTVNEGATVTLDGSGSTDIDDGIATYLWTQTGGKQTILSNPNAQNPTFTAPNVPSAGDILVFQLTVTDAGDLTDTDTVSITVGGDNDPPVADAGPDQTVNEGTTATLDGSGSSDPDDGIATYLWEQTAGTVVTLSDTSATQPTFVAPDVGADGGTVPFQLTVTDTEGLQDSDTCTVNISWVNAPPVADAGPDQTVNEGTTATLDGSGSTDSDDGIASYVWTQTGGTSITLSDPNAVQPTFTAPDVGTGGAVLTFDLTVTDNGGLPDTDTVLINVSNKIIVGDVDDNGVVGLSDAILALQVLTGMEQSSVVHKEADVNNDGKIGLVEAIYILQTVAGLRSGINDSGGIWTTKANMPTARDYLTACSVNEKIYAIGGLIYGDVIIDTVEEYNPATNTWATKASIPTARTGIASAVVDGKIYVFGGMVCDLDGSAWASEKTEVYDPENNTWQTRTDMPTALNNPSAIAVGGKIYVIGGKDASYSNLATVDEYDPLSNIWTPKTPMPTARSQHSCNVIGGKIYVIGGEDSSYNGLDTVEQYDPTTNTWMSKAAMTTARRGLTAGVINDRIYAVGGSDEEQLDTVEEYDPSTNTWVPKTSMPTKRAGLASGVVNGKMYVIGGWNDISSSYSERFLSVVEEYTP